MNSGDEGRREMLTWLQQCLLVNLQVDQVEGLNLREHQKSGPAAARQARKQFKDVSELVIAISRDLEARR